MLDPVFSVIPKHIEAEAVYVFVNFGHQLTLQVRPLCDIQLALKD